MAYERNPDEKKVFLQTKTSEKTGNRYYDGFDKESRMSYRVFVSDKGCTLIVRPMKDRPQQNFQPNQNQGQQPDQNRGYGGTQQGGGFRQSGEGRGNPNFGTSSGPDEDPFPF
jgi:hypothetical protein